MRTLGLLNWWKPTATWLHCLLFGHTPSRYGGPKSCRKCGQRKKYKKGDS